MRLRSVFARLPLLTQKLLAVLCVHFVRVSATHPRKLRIATECSSTLSGKCGGSVEQRSPKFRPDQKKHQGEEYAQLSQESQCESVTRGQTSPTEQLDGDQSDVDASRTAAKESGHFRSGTRQHDISARDQILSDLFRFPSRVD